MNCSYSYIIEYPKGEKRNQILSNDIRELMCLERHVDLNNHEDVHYMKPTGKTGYRVGDADTFIKSLSMMPHGDLSIGVIDDADSMSEIIQNIKLWWTLSLIQNFSINLETQLRRILIVEMMLSN